MTRSKSIIGALVLCALALCAFGAASASATVGLTAVECEEVKAGAGNYTTSVCETPKVSASNFETVAFALNTPKEVEGTSVANAEGFGAVLTGTIALAKVDISCTSSTSTGKVTNVTPEGATKEMKIEGTATVTHYTGCTARLSADTGVNKEACKVKAITGGQGEGKITTTELKSITSAEHVITLEPTTGTTFSEFEVLNVAETGKTCSLPTTKVTVTGKAAATANTEKHSHVTFTTGGTALRANGAAATYAATYAGHTKEAPTKVVGAMTVE
jgi:hypothetical protein